MDPADSPRLHYRRSRFSTSLPRDFRYLPSHVWIQDLGDNRRRAGLTRFATRMLGDMVDHGFEVEPGQSVTAGLIIGWVEGFKAISDLYCAGSGTFVRANPDLASAVTLVSKSPYDRGWLYEFDGAPDTRAMDVLAYRDLLDQTIDRILEQQKDPVPDEPDTDEP